MLSPDAENTVMPANNPSQGTTKNKRKRHMFKRAGGGALAVIGFILSPISWWNDLLVNIPLAYLFAGVATWAQPEWFNIAFIIGYLLTNVLGLTLV